MASGPDLLPTTTNMSLSNGYSHLSNTGLNHTPSYALGNDTPLTNADDLEQSLLNNDSPEEQEEESVMFESANSEGEDEDDAIGEDDEEFDEDIHTISQHNGKRQSISSESSSKSSKRKRDTFEEDDHMLQNPELYGLRRSGRARQTRQQSESSDEDEDDDIVHNGRRKRQKSVKTRPASLKSSALSSEQDTDSEDDVYGGARQRTNKKSRLKAGTSSRSTPLGDVRFSTRRTAKVTNYNEAEDVDEFAEEDDGTPQQWTYTEETGPAIDAVLDHRPKAGSSSDADSKTDFEYLIKWQGEAHYHATWQEWSTVTTYRGFRRLENYFRKIVSEDLYINQDPDVPPEERERWLLDRETKLEELSQRMKVERVIARRTEHNGTEYLVKWKALYYESCTWERASLVSELAQPEIDHFLDRASRLPSSDKKEANPATRSPYQRIFTQPDYIKGGTLRDFQLVGINFLAHHWCNSNNVILADEMGLGKTVQTVGFTNWLIQARKQEGPFLIVVPLSTLPAWAETYALWAPDINFVVYNGNEPSRRIIREHELFVNGDVKKVKFNVMLTTYEFINTDVTLLSQIKWQFMAVDEAHRLKNRSSQLYANLLNFGVPSRLLITGTPMQNTLSELSSLMDFLMPGKIKVDDNLDLTDEDATRKITELSNAVKPYMIRRTKQTVENDLPPKTEKIIRIELADLQLEFYKNILARNYTALNAGSGTHKMSLLNLVMELKKASNHAFMFPSAEDRVLGNSEHSREDQLKAVVQNSGKMIVLDRLLTKLKKEGHRVLIFSQMVGMLNILVDYLSLRGYQYQRLDGTIPSGARKLAIDHFNAPGSQDFVFLLSTRAGGLGINLMTADTVILFDSDWNPQADLQAMARAHRIGQKKPVSVYRFVSKDTIEEEILERARNKLMLEFITIQRGVTDKDATKELTDRVIKAGASISEPTTAADISRILKKRGQKMFEQKGNQKKLEELDIDDLLENAELHQTEQPEGMATDGGEDFLRSFEYTDVKLDLEWDEIIPKDELDKIKAQDSERANQEYLKSIIEENAPRKRKAPDDGRDQRAAKKRARALTAEAADDADSDDEDAIGDPSRPLSEKDCRNLIKAFERYGSIDEMEKEIIRDARLLNRDTNVVKATLKTILDEGERLLAAEHDRIRDLEATTGRPATKKDRKTVLFDFKGVKRLNAETLKERPEDLSTIRAEVTAASNWSNFRISEATKSASYTCAWGAREDGMLIVGIARHGYGAWAAIRDDLELGLDDKLFLEEHRVGAKTARNDGEEDKAKSPGAVHLVRRTAYLISVLRNKSSGGADETAKRALENHHRNTKKPALARVATPQTGSASPLTRPAKNGVKADTKREKLSTTNGVSKSTHSKDPSKSVKRRISEERLRKKTPEPAEEDVKLRAKILSPIKKALQSVGRATKKHIADDKDRLRVLKKGIIEIGIFITEDCAKTPGITAHDLWNHVACNHWPLKQGTSTTELTHKLKAMYASVAGKNKPDANSSTEKPAEHTKEHSTKQDDHLASANDVSSQQDRRTPALNGTAPYQDRFPGLSFQRARPGDRAARDERVRERDNREDRPRSRDNRDRQRERSPRRDDRRDHREYRERERDNNRARDSNRERERYREDPRDKGSRPQIDSYRPVSRDRDTLPGRGHAYSTGRDGERPGSRQSNGDNRRHSPPPRNRHHDRPYNTQDRHRTTDRNSEARRDHRRNTSSDSNRSFRDERRSRERDTYRTRT